MRRKQVKFDFINVPFFVLFLFCVGAINTQPGAEVTEGDWPLWRYDAQRRAATPVALAEELHPQWTLVLPAPARAWLPQHENLDKLDFDVSYSPIVLDDTLFIASMVTDSLVAYDIRTAREKWRFYADGPMRLAPAAWKGRVYAVSDDGFLYCVDAGTGAELWRFRGGPEDRRLLGNTRLVNIWAARGGPVVKDGRVYFAASVWPLMGTFIHGLDAVTGEPLWSNTGMGAHYNLHQHGGAYAFGGVAPQGYLAATDSRLLVSGGRTVPAVHDLATGEFLYFEQASGTIGKGVGGYRVAVQGDWYYNHGLMYSLEDGAQLDDLAADVLTDEEVYVVTREGDGCRVEAYAASPDEDVTVEIENRLERGALKNRYSHRRLWEAPMEAPIERFHLRAGNRLYGSGPEGLVVAVDLHEGDRPARVSWKATVDGEVWEMLAAAGRLFVVTVEGTIQCFGVEKQEHPACVEEMRPDSQTPLPEASVLRAKGMLESAGVSGGYAISFGAGKDFLAEALARQSDLHVIVVEPRADLVASLRERYRNLGLYGRRIAVHQGDARTFSLPPYMAELVVVEDMDAVGSLDAEAVNALFHPLRPYGGTAVLPLSAGLHERFVAVATLLPEVVVERVGEWSMLRRQGALPGAGKWTHQYADASNTSHSPDLLAKAPLGVLWYGGPTNENILPRHGQGPIPHVFGGRVILPGVNTLSARDVYTGRELWVREFPGIGNAFTNLELEERYWSGEAVYMTNLPGANFIGSFYASTDDGVYVRYQGVIHWLDPASGSTLATFPVAQDDAGAHQDYGHISLWEELLITSVAPQYFDDEPIGGENWNATSSNGLIVRNRHTGEMLWSRSAHIGFRHNTIVSGADKLFVVDGLSEEATDRLARRGLLPEASPKLFALDMRTGEELWRVEEDVFGTFLLYSQEHDLLLQTGRHGGKRVLPDEPNRSMTAHNGATGAVVWSRAIGYAGPVSLHDSWIIPGRPGTMLELLTGDPVDRMHPLTGESVSRAYHRTYGCGTLNTSPYLLMFRSGAAGFTDLATDAGTGNLSGFKAGCTNNLIPADGVLNAPDYTRTCTCAYQNQISLAFIHMPEVEMWTYNQLTRGNAPVLRAGVNLAAPGSHMADTGTLWIEYPRVGGPAPEFPVRMTPEQVDTFRIHASLIDAGDGGVPTVVGSGVLGLDTLELELADADASTQSRRYTVRLHFMEPEDIKPGGRVFDVYVQGGRVASSLDVVAETGVSRRGLVREFPDVSVRDILTVELRRVEGSSYPTLLCGVEVVCQESGLSVQTSTVK